MSPDEIRALIHRLVDAHNRHDPEAATACFTPDITNHGRAAGRDGMAAIYRSLYQAFPDFHFEIEQLLIDGAWATAVYRMTGTHAGLPALPVLGGLLVDVPPTRQPVDVLNIHVYRIEDGLIAEHRAVRDDLGMMQQLGLLPATHHSAGDISRPAPLEPSETPPSSEVQVRPYRPGDKSTVMGLWHQCGLVVPGNDPEQDIARKQQVQPDLFLVAELQGQIIGTVMAGYEGHRGWVNYVAVTPECQHSGVGRLLMEQAEAALRDLGCPKVSLQIRPTNRSVIRFYERLGYTVEDRVSMGKRLT